MQSIVLYYLGVTIVKQYVGKRQYTKMHFNTIKCMNLPEYWTCVSNNWALLVGRSTLVHYLGGLHIGYHHLLCLSYSMNGVLEFYDTEPSDVICMNQAEHFMATDVEWDPTGRFVATSVSWWAHKVSQKTSDIKKSQNNIGIRDVQLIQNMACYVPLYVLCGSLLLN